MTIPNLPGDFAFTLPLVVWLEQAKRRLRTRIANWLLGVAIAIDDQCPNEPPRRSENSGQDDSERENFYGLRPLSQRHAEYLAASLAMAEHDAVRGRGWKA